MERVVEVFELRDKLDPRVDTEVNTEVILDCTDVLYVCTGDGWPSSPPVCL